MPKKLSIPDQRMLQLIEWAVNKKLAATESDFLEDIGFHRNNIVVVRRGGRKFTREQIFEACRITGASTDWIFGFINTMKRSADKQPIEQLKAAVTAIENQLNHK